MPADERAAMRWPRSLNAPGKGTHHDAGIQDQVIDAGQPLQGRRRRFRAGQIRQIQLLAGDAALCGKPE